MNLRSFSFQNFGIIVIHNPTQSLHFILCRPKITIANNGKHNTVYKIICSSCVINYADHIGYTSHTC